MSPFPCLSYILKKFHSIELQLNVTNHVCFFAGSPFLISNVNSFTGVLCDTPVKFTCHTFEPVVALDWYIDDNILVSYTYRGESLPVFPSTNRSLLDAGVVISTAVPDNNGNVDYGNVTLTTTLNSLAQIQGSSLSCGKFFLRSNFIMINNYTIYGKKFDTISSEIKSLC